MNAVIIDDENKARDNLKKLIATYCQFIVIVGEASNGTEGLSLIRASKPDLVFLDVEMPDMDGFQLLEELGTIDFSLIFVTAFNKYAIQAFEFSAVGYLLKPIDKTKLITTIMQAQEFRRLKQLENQYKLLLEITKTQHSESPFNHRILLSNQEETIFINFKDLIRVEANGNCSTIYANGQPKPIFMSKSIKEYEKLFADAPFMFRIHRGHLINLHYVIKFVKGDESGVLVKNYHDDKMVVAPVSKENKIELLEKLQNLK